MSRPILRIPIPDSLLALWETRAGRVLQRIGLDSVRTTILTLAVMATLIPALATSYISYRQNRRAIAAKLEQQLSGSSTQAAREVGLWLKERLYDLRVFAASYEVTEGVGRTGGGSRRLPEYLGSVNQRFPDYEELMVVGPDGRPVASSERVAGRLHFGGNWLQQARLGDPVLGEPSRTDSARHTSMEVAVPIVNAAGRFLGVLAARLNFTAVEEPLQHLVAGVDGRLLVARSDGEPIAAVRGPFMTLSEGTLRQLANVDSSAARYDAPDGIAVIGMISGVPGTDWTVVAEIPASTAFADIRQQRNATILLVLVLLLVVGTLAYGLGLLIVLPVERLSSAADRVASGDLDVDVPVSGRGEVSQLTAVFNDMVRRLRDGRAELERLSVTDELTGLANRRRLVTELERELHRSDRHERSFSVLMLDVDRFKHFNDTYGHPAGDVVLKRLAQLLRDNAREVDTVARYGGEEFLMILPETKATDVASIAERIRQGAESDRFTPVEGDTELNVTVSIGFSLFPEHARTAEELIGAADKALYRSKQEGRNRVTGASGSAPSAAPKPRKRRSSGA